MLEWLVALLWLTFVLMLVPRLDRRRPRPSQAETIDNFAIVEVMRRVEERKRRINEKGK